MCTAWPNLCTACCRYEDEYTNPGHPFACGITLDRISGYTVDAEGKEAFVTNNPLQMLRKVGGQQQTFPLVGTSREFGWICRCPLFFAHMAPTSCYTRPSNPTRPSSIAHAQHPPHPPQALVLRRMAVYFDTDAEFWVPEGVTWHDLAPHDWDDWFLPGISSERQERGGTARHRQYVLQPVDGRALYTRRGAGVTHKGEARQLQLGVAGCSGGACCLMFLDHHCWNLPIRDLSFMCMFCLQRMSQWLRWIFSWMSWHCACHVSNQHPCLLVAAPMPYCCALLLVPLLLFLALHTC